jgi:CheY-like chemotaxis protein
VEKLGYTVLEARTGKEAIQVAQDYDGQIDFALLDVILPDMSGSQIYPELKKLRPDLKVIVCSGFSLDGPARQILNDGAETFLPKPFSVAALSSTLDDIFKTSRKAVK